MGFGLFVRVAGMSDRVFGIMSPGSPVSAMKDLQGIFP